MKAHRDMLVLAFASFGVLIVFAGLSVIGASLRNVPLTLVPLVVGLGFLLWIKVRIDRLSEAPRSKHS